MALVQRIGVEADIKKALYCAEVETDMYIVNRARYALSILKQHATEEHRQHFRVALTILAPEKVAKGDQKGTIPSLILLHFIVCCC